MPDSVPLDLSARPGARLHKLRVAPEGLPFILATLAASVLSALLAMAISGKPTIGLVALLFGLTVTLAVAAFFRDPDREIPTDPLLIVSPADGKVMAVTHDEQQVAITVFLSVLNVHVNRAPVTGSVTAVRYRPGQFLAAYRPEVPLVNEANEIEQATPFGPVKTIQIAGLIARRIVCRANVDQLLEIGQRYGLIRFGSCMQVVLPSSAIPLARVGDTVRAGSSAIARWPRPPLPASE